MPPAIHVAFRFWNCRVDVSAPNCLVRIGLTLHDRLAAQTPHGSPPDGFSGHYSEFSSHICELYTKPFSILSWSDRHLLNESPSERLLVSKPRKAGDSL